MDALVTLHAVIKVPSVTEEFQKAYQERYDDQELMEQE